MSKRAPGGAGRDICGLAPKELCSMSSRGSYLSYTVLYLLRRPESGIKKMSKQKAAKALPPSPEHIGQVSVTNNIGQSGIPLCFSWVMQAFVVIALGCPL